MSGKCNLLPVSKVMKLKRILCKYYDRLATHRFDIGHLKGVEMEINLKEDAHPVCYRPYPLNEDDIEAMDKFIDEGLEHGLISPIDSEWAAPAFIVTNNDGTKRVVIDYKALNSMTKTLSYPPPDINDALRKFRGKKWLSKFDINKAFHNVKVRECDKDKMAFVTHRGVFTWNVMPFGNKNNPSYWALASDKVFLNLEDLAKYIDDLALASKTFDGHLQAIAEFFQRLATSNLKVRMAKCEFFAPEITFVGHKSQNME